MKKRIERSIIACLSAIVLLSGITQAQAQVERSTTNLSIPSAPTGTFARFIKTGLNNWSIVIKRKDSLLMNERFPLKIEIFEESHILQLRSAYQTVRKLSGGFLAWGTINYKTARFIFKDTWTLKNGDLNLSRTVKVGGHNKASFLSSFSFEFNKASGLQTQFFAPGMIYGKSEHLTPSAIGGSLSGSHIRIREDRLPAPLFGVRLSSGDAACILDAAPNGSTSNAEANDLTTETLSDPRFRFGSIGIDTSKGQMKLGYWFPGSEGETTYRGNTYPNGQIHHWRRRYHPIADGLSQSYQLAFRFSREPALKSMVYHDWRWAWNILKPAVNHQDIELCKTSLINMLGEQVITEHGITGIPNWISANTSPKEPPASTKTIMGFTGKALESANYLLQSADDDHSALALNHREEGLAIIRTFLHLKLNPPEGEGFEFTTGKPALALASNVYLRSFGDDLKALLKAAKRERKFNRDHSDWIQWTRTFADWLLPQQNGAGGFPRSWQAGTGVIADSSSQSSFTIIPFLVLLSDFSGDVKYKDAALKAGMYCLRSQLGTGFVGGTIDNPNVLDKEAGTLSLEAYTALFKATGDRRWLSAAYDAANFAETWIYSWNVPMPCDTRNEDLGWKKGVPTVGLQLIATGHSLCDAYMAFDVDEFAGLYRATGDRHDYEVARLLLHNTLAMLAVPGRLYDLKGPGWQQEHWSLAPVRGNGLHRGWLPWVSTSHLNGIYDLKEADLPLYQQMIR